MKIIKQYPNIEKEMIAVEKNILLNISSRQPVISKAVGELLDAGGKRLRPLVLVLSSMFGHYDRDKIVPLAACVEILHMATLIHDDIIDDAFIRRGNKTLQAKWGKDIAVFTGDYLFAKLFFLAYDSIDKKVLKKITHTTRLICEGEILQYSFRYNKDISVLKYLKIIAYKTAILFKTSCYLGALVTNCSYDIQRAVQGYGFNLGMAFQIIDDILDYTAKSKDLGKPVNNDLIHGIYTLPVIYALSNKEYRNKLLELMVCEDIDVDKISNIVYQAGGIGYSKQLAKKYINKAENYLRTLPISTSREIMGSILKDLKIKLK